MDDNEPTKSIQETLSQEELIEITNIQNRWQDNKTMYCKRCMYEAIRHWDRNMDPVCDSYDEEDHPDRYDGDIFAHAGKDIWFLLDLLKKIDPELIKSAFVSEDTSSEDTSSEMRHG
jgi:hypothetical protein